MTRGRARGSGPRGLLQGRRELGVRRRKGSREPTVRGAVQYLGMLGGVDRGGQGVPTPRWQMVSSGGFGVESAPPCRGARTPRLRGARAGEGVPGARMGRTSAKSCGLFGRKFAASLLPGGGRRAGCGCGCGRGGSGPGAAAPRCLCLPGAPPPSGGPASRRGLQRARQRGRRVGSCGTAGSGRPEPVVPGTRRRPACPSLACTSTGFQRTTLRWALALACSSDSGVECGAGVPTCRLSRNLARSWQVRRLVGRLSLG